MLETQKLLEAEQYLSYLAMRNLLSPHGVKMLESVRDEIDVRARMSIYGYYINKMMNILESKRTKKKARRIKIAIKKPIKKAYKIRRAI